MRRTTHIEPHPQTDKPELVVPIVHDNGDRAETLINQLDAVWFHLENAYLSLRQAGPNGRNYYPEPGRMEQAVEQHQRRQRIIHALQCEIEREMNAIAEQSK